MNFVQLSTVFNDLNTTTKWFVCSALEPKILFWSVGCARMEKLRPKMMTTTTTHDADHELRDDDVIFYIIFTESFKIRCPKKRMPKICRCSSFPVSVRHDSPYTNAQSHSHSKRFKSFSLLFFFATNKINFQLLFSFIKTLLTVRHHRFEWFFWGYVFSSQIHFAADWHYDFFDDATGYKLRSI